MPESSETGGGFWDLAQSSDKYDRSWDKLLVYLIYLMATVLAFFALAAFEEEAVCVLPNNILYPYQAFFNHYCLETFSHIALQAVERLLLQVAALSTLELIWRLSHQRHALSSLLDHYRRNFHKALEEELPVGERNMAILRNEDKSADSAHGVGRGLHLPIGRCYTLYTVLQMTLTVLFLAWAAVEYVQHKNDDNFGHFMCHNLCQWKLDYRDQSLCKQLFNGTPVVVESPYSFGHGQYQHPGGSEDSDMAQPLSLDEARQLLRPLTANDSGGDELLVDIETPADCISTAARAAHFLSYPNLTLLSLYLAVAGKFISLVVIPQRHRFFATFEAGHHHGDSDKPVKPSVAKPSMANLEYSSGVGWSRLDGPKQRGLHARRTASMALWTRSCMSTICPHLTLTAWRLSNEAFALMWFFQTHSRSKPVLFAHNFNSSAGTQLSASSLACAYTLLTLTEMKFVIQLIDDEQAQRNPNVQYQVTMMSMMLSLLTCVLQGNECLCTHNHPQVPIEIWNIVLLHSGVSRGTHDHVALIFAHCDTLERVARIPGICTVLLSHLGAVCAEYIRRMCSFYDLEQDVAEGRERNRVVTVALARVRDCYRHIGRTAGMEAQFGKHASLLLSHRLFGSDKHDRLRPIYDMLPDIDKARALALRINYEYIEQGLLTEYVDEEFIYRDSFRLMRYDLSSADVAVEAAAAAALMLARASSSERLRKGLKRFQERVLQSQFPGKFGPPSRSRELIWHVDDFDTNGVLYSVATHNQTAPWVNPCLQNPPLVQVSSSSLAPTSAPVYAIVGSRNVACMTVQEKHAWFAIDLLTRQVRPTAYSLRCCAGMPPLRNWRFEGSVDGMSWSLLREHYNSPAFLNGRLTATWTIKAEVSARFRLFRVVQTSQSGNSASVAHKSRRPTRNSARVLSSLVIPRASLGVPPSSVLKTLSSTSVLSGSPSRHSESMSPFQASPTAHHHEVAAFPSSRSLSPHPGGAAAAPASSHLNLLALGQEPGSGGANSRRARRRTHALVHSRRASTDLLSMPDGLVASGDVLQKLVQAAFGTATAADVEPADEVNRETPTHDDGEGDEDEDEQEHEDEEDDEKKEKGFPDEDPIAALAAFNRKRRAPSASTEHFPDERSLLLSMDTDRQRTPAPVRSSSALSAPTPTMRLELTPGSPNEELELDSCDADVLCLCGFELYGTLFDVLGDPEDSRSSQSLSYVEGKGEVERVFHHKPHMEFHSGIVNYMLNTNFVVFREFTSSSLLSSYEEVHLPNVEDQRFLCVTRPEPNSWLCLRVGCLVRPTAFALRHSVLGVALSSSFKQTGSLPFSNEAIRNWKFEASVDGRNWTTLSTHRNDATLNLHGDSHVWTLPKSHGVEGFSMFRILQDGPNSDNHYFLVLGGFELFGTMFLPSDALNSAPRTSVPDGFRNGAVDGTSRSQPVDSVTAAKSPNGLAVGQATTSHPGNGVSTLVTSSTSADDGDDELEMV